jgi:chromosome partitioning protein
LNVLVLVNQKGGVGKTTTVFHLAALAIERGLKVLAVDLDPQGNLSTALTGDYELPTRDGGAESLFFPDHPLTPAVVHPALHLLHGHQHLESVERSVDIDRVLATAPRVRTLPYDVVLIDTPPSVGLRQLAPLFWADQVLIPIEPDDFSTTGLAAIIRTLAIVRNGNRTVRHRAIINRHVRSSRYQRAMIDDLRQHVALLEPFLTARVCVGEAMARRVPVWSLPHAPQAARRDWRLLCEAVYA